jgi:hypothetical protein
MKMSVFEYTHLNKIIILQYISSYTDTWPENVEVYKIQQNNSGHSYSGQSRLCSNEKGRQRERQKHH